MGFNYITNVDISTVVINNMTDLYANREEMDCKFINFSYTYNFSQYSIYFIIFQFLLWMFVKWNMFLMDVLILLLTKVITFTLLLSSISNFNFIYIFLALFDALLCSENNLDDLNAYLTEVKRILKTDGVYFMVSHSSPEKRLHILNQNFLYNPGTNSNSNNFVIDYQKIVKPDIKNYNESDDSHFYFIYTIKKLE